MDTTTIAHPAPEPTTREQRGLALYRERGEGIEKVAPDFYLVPNQDGRRFYHVDYRDETCDCPDHEHRGVTCLHIYAVGIKLAKRRAKAVRCDGCGERHRRRDMYEVEADHPTFFEGDDLCGPCASRAGVR